RKRYYVDYTGCGNTLDVRHSRALQLVMDSLRYWVQEMHVDGFRFDLGTILAREPNGFDYRSGFLKVCSQDPVLTGVKLIAEPWDCGPGGYQMGEFPPGWGEWNDKFRDTVRDYWRGEAPAAALAPRLYGSADIFDRNGRRPQASVNFVTAHDGFTLNDLVSYNERHNEANGEENRDGHVDNRSWNCGVEGPTDDEAINALRKQQMRNFLATLLLSQGTPMLTAGDEFARTQGGNNNAYCQDNEISWVDWTLAETNIAQVRFVQALTALRRRYPILRRNRFLSTVVNEAIGVKELTWINSAGVEMQEEDWTNGQRCFGMLLDGRAQVTGLKQRGQDATLLLILNSHHEPVPFTLPGAGDDSAHALWTLVLDTQIAEPAQTAEDEHSAGDTRSVAARSLLLLKLKLPPEAPLWSEQR
ncbi:MAG TPA: glycogen debranching enzyme GlgX, partial [Gammaproteobacteria bacterium]|nr:glycogen debranching enzyme GlgX [Gammaproteobacteria bacterium]